MRCSSLITWPYHCFSVIFLEACRSNMFIFDRILLGHFQSVILITFTSSRASCPFKNETLLVKRIVARSIPKLQQLMLNKDKQKPRNAFHFKPKQFEEGRSSIVIYPPHALCWMTLPMNQFYIGCSQYQCHRHHERTFQTVTRAQSNATTRWHQVTLTSHIDMILHWPVSHYSVLVNIARSRKAVTSPFLSFALANAERVAECIGLWQYSM